MAGARIRTSGLTHLYGRNGHSVLAVDSVDLDIPSGQFVCVMGPSGSGKSTRLHLLAGLRSATRGEAWIGDTDVQRLSQDEVALFRRRRIGIVFQSFNLLESLTVRQNVALPRLMDGLSFPHVRDDVDSLFDRLGILGKADFSLGELSGGQIQRVAIARALVARPAVVLADEPTGNLDRGTGAEVLKLLREVCVEHGVTTVLVSHDPDSRRYADRVVQMIDGRVLPEGDQPASLLGEANS